MEIKDRQLQILEAAGTVLNEQGIGGLTTKNVARQVGFAESALYRHYDSKEAIVSALLEYLYACLDQRLSPIAIATGLAPEERLRRYFEAHLDFITSHPHFLSAVFSEGLFQFSPEIKERMMNLISLMRNNVGQIVSEGQKNGAFTCQIPPEELSHILIGSYRMLMLRWHLDNFGFDVKSEGLRHVGYLISCVLKKELT